MGSLLQYRPIPQHDDLIGVHDGGEPVSNDQTGAGTGNLVNIPQNFPLRSTVKRRCGLIEDVYERAFQRCPRYRDTLTLSAREFDTALTHSCRVALRERHDEIVQVRHPRCLLDFLLRAARPAEADVV